MKSLLFLLTALLLPAFAALAQEPAATNAPVPAASAPPPAVAAPAPPAQTPETEEPVERAMPIPRMPLPPPPPGVLSQDFVGHRLYESKIDSGGWGWVRLPSEGWSRGRWVALRETPGVAVAPWRYKGGDKGDDQNYEYVLHGYIAPYQVYDPHTDEMLDVFVLEKVVKTLGPAKPLGLRPGPKSRRRELVPVSHEHSV